MTFDIQILLIKKKIKSIKFWADFACSIHQLWQQTNNNYNRVNVKKKNFLLKQMKKQIEKKNLNLSNFSFRDWFDFVFCFKSLFLMKLKWNENHWPFHQLTKKKKKNKTNIDLTERPDIVIDLEIIKCLMIFLDNFL